MQVKRGRVYLVGAGPGDWELITVKGLKCVREADVILYDFLATDDLLRFAKKGAELICVGKSDGLHLCEQEKINKLLGKKAQENKAVVRLKGGDPFVFSRGIEEALYLKKKKIPFEIVQGVTSAFAAPESFGIPLTRRGRFDSIAVLTGRKSNGDDLDAPECDTLVYLMAVGAISKVVQTLLESGREKNTPCAFLERATTRQERIVCGTLGSIESRAARAAVKSPSVFIVGEVARYGRKIYAHKY